MTATESCSNNPTLNNLNPIESCTKIKKIIASKIPLEIKKKKKRGYVYILVVYLIPFVHSGLGPHGTGKDCYTQIHTVQDKMVQGNFSVSKTEQLSLKCFISLCPGYFSVQKDKIPKIQILFSTVSVSRVFEPFLVMALSAMKILGFPHCYKSYALGTEGYQLFSQVYTARLEHNKNI